MQLNSPCNFSISHLYAFFNEKKAKWNKKASPFCVLIELLKIASNIAYKIIGIISFLTFMLGNMSTITNTFDIRTSYI